MTEVNKRQARQPRDRLVAPFLKWPGGKRWLVPILLDVVGRYNFKTYFEPFLGGGAFFFALQPADCLLSDINADLINAYRQVKQSPELLVSRLRSLPINRQTYESVRLRVPERPLDRAIRFIYLNRTAFAGMYRVNQNGEFNVPFGGERTTAALWNRDLIQQSSKSLRSAALRRCDFEEVVAQAGSGSLVYCDPTYTVAHNNNGFIRYNEKNFSWDDQKRLARACRQAARRGALVLVSNAFHLEVLTLFSPPSYLVVKRQSRLCPNVKFRRSTEEYLFIFPPARDSWSARRPNLVSR